MILFHGIAAYRGTRRPMQQLRAIENCFDKQIAVATRPIGPIGVMFTGEVIAAYPQDCWSWVDEEGNRLPGEDWEDYQCPADLGDSSDLERWLKEMHHNWFGSDYAELFMEARAVARVWVKAYAGESVKKTARVMARKYGVELVTVGRNTTPWEVVGDYYSPYESLAEQHGYA